MRYTVSKRRLGVVALVAAGVAAVAVAVAFAAMPGGGAQRRAVVSKAHNAALGRTILVDRRGRTLYHLSVERHGRFVCTTGMCLSLWKPLVVSKGTHPTGAQSLATVRRPDGLTQVTYRGAPLYTFTGDHKRGDAAGNGFRDVGVWRPAFVSAQAAAAPTPKPQSGGGYPGY